MKYDKRDSQIQHVSRRNDHNIPKWGGLSYNIYLVIIYNYDDHEQHAENNANVGETNSSHLFVGAFLETSLSSIILGFRVKKLHIFYL